MHREVFFFLNELDTVYKSKRDDSSKRRDESKRDAMNPKRDAMNPKKRRDESRLYGRLVLFFLILFFCESVRIAYRVEINQNFGA